MKYMISGRHSLVELEKTDEIRLDYKDKARLADFISEDKKLDKDIYIYTTDILKGGLGDEILEYINKHKFTNKIHIIGIDDCFVSHGNNQKLKENLNIDIKSLFELIRGKND